MELEIEGKRRRGLSRYRHVSRTANGHWIVVISSKLPFKKLCCYGTFADEDLAGHLADAARLLIRGVFPWNFPDPNDPTKPIIPEWAIRLAKEQYSRHYPQIKGVLPCPESPAAIEQLSSPLPKDRSPSIR